MKEKIENLKIVGFDERIPHLTHKTKEGDKIKLGSLEIEPFFVPFHTSGHLVYTIKEIGSDRLCLMSGDTLFLAGSGRFFEGDANQAFQAFKKIRSLPPHTLIFCGHEYSITNLKFALSIEPNNPEISKKLEWAIERRNHYLPTIPSTLSEELLHNPFLRYDIAQVSQAVSIPLEDPVSIISSLRERKNNF